VQQEALIQPQKSGLKVNVTNLAKVTQVRCVVETVILPVFIKYHNLEKIQNVKPGQNGMEVIAKILKTTVWRRRFKCQMEAAIIMTKIH